ncbi:MAG TPA: twin-arginine translocation signal domain-containing protein [Synechococcales cyanobacterium M55_K2018_004]|nr:twin-arginine translocation signal domain-containing protein [Synechococcales cyanobacterium M55_K2018_004]
MFELHRRQFLKYSSLLGATALATGTGLMKPSAIASDLTLTMQLD